MSSTARSLTVRGVSNPWPLVEIGCLGTGINSEMGSEIGGPGRDGLYASEATVVVGA